MAKPLNNACRNEDQNSRRSEIIDEEDSKQNTLKSDSKSKSKKDDNQISGTIDNERGGSNEFQLAKPLNNACRNEDQDSRKPEIIDEESSNQNTIKVKVKVKVKFQDQVKEG